MKRKGIALKTFIFTSVIVLIVILVSFGTLYVVMPDYYLKTKVNSFAQNSMKLYEDIEYEEDLEVVSQLVQEFTKINNAEVYCYDTEDNLLLLLYNPAYIDNSIGFSYIETEMDARSLETEDGMSQAETAVIIPAENKEEELLLMLELPEEFQNTGRTVEADQLKISVVTEEEDENYETVTIRIHSEQNDSSEYIPYYIINEFDETQEENHREYYVSGTNNLRYINTAKSALTYEIVFYDHPLLNSVQIISNLQPINEASDILISLIPYLLGVNMVIGLFAAFIYSRKFTKPIIKISEAAVQMQNLEPGIESSVHTWDELGELSVNLDLLYNKLLNNINVLEEEMDKVQRLEKSKTDFMQAASHELKTPLAGLKGILEGMIDGVGKYKDRDKYLEEAGKLTDKMTHLVYEILNASKMDSDIKLNMEKTDAGLLLNEVLEGYEFLFSEEDIDLTYNVPEKPVFIKTDVMVLKTILSNIISNAVKYNDNRKRIFAGILSDGNKHILYIENTCKIDKNAEIYKFFEPFYTGSYSRDRNLTGTGLGLYIAKKNLERLGLTYEMIPTDMGIRFNIYFEE